MTTERATRGHPLKIGPSNVEGPAYLIPWVTMLQAYITPDMGTFSPTCMAAEALNGLLAAGWLPPNDPDEEDETGPSEADVAAREVADLVWRATTCPDDQRPGIQALAMEALQRYRKRIT